MKLVPCLFESFILMAWEELRLLVHVLIFLWYTLPITKIYNRSSFPQQPKKKKFIIKFIVWTWGNSTWMELQWEILFQRKIFSQFPVRRGKLAFINFYCPFRKGIQKSLLSLGHLANSWDEWVGVDRLLKHTEENVMKQQALQKKQGADRSSKSGRSAQTKQKSSTG